MAMGTRRQRQRQEELWYRGALAEAPGHPFYRRLNELLDQAGFDEFCESTLPEVLSREAGATVAGAGDLLPGDADRVFRRDRERARNCVEGSGFIVLAGVSANRTG